MTSMFYCVITGVLMDEGTWRVRLLRRESIGVLKGLGVE